MGLAQRSQSRAVELNSKIQAFGFGGAGARHGPKNSCGLECAPDGGQIASRELTGTAGLSEDESHGQAPHLQR
jgi:hypothetical protein